MSSIRRMMMAAGRGGSAVDWESIARGFCDNTLPFTMVEDIDVNPRLELLSGYTLMSGSVKFKDGVTTIAAGNVYQCSLIERVTVPSSVTSIGNNFCRNCPALEVVVCNMTTPATLGQRCFMNSNNLSIYVPDASVAAYKAASGWSDYASRIFPMSDLTT